MSTSCFLELLHSWCFILKHSMAWMVCKIQNVTVFCLLELLSVFHSTILHEPGDLSSIALLSLTCLVIVTTGKPDLISCPVRKPKRLVRIKSLSFFCLRATFKKLWRKRETSSCWLSKRSCQAKASNNEDPLYCSPVESRALLNCLLWTTAGVIFTLKSGTCHEQLVF